MQNSNEREDKDFNSLGTGHYNEGKIFNFIGMFVCKMFKCSTVIIERTCFQLYSIYIV